MATSINPTSFLPTTVSTASQWILWHQALKARYGKATANTLFLDAWQHRQSSKANTTELRAYLTDNGMTIEEGYFGYVADFFDEATGMLALGSKAGLYGGAAIVVLLLIPIMIFLINLARKPDTVVKLGSQLAAL